MVIVVFRARSRPDLPAAIQRELEARSQRMAELAFGREHVFSEYHIQVCDLVRESRFPR